MSDIIFGIITSILATLLLLLLNRSWEYLKIKKRMNLSKGIILKTDKCKININEGYIQNKDKYDQNAVIVLPANTTFVDDCIYDKKSALGAFFQKFYHTKINEIIKVIKESLLKYEKLKNENDEYPPGTSILLPDPYNSPANIVITASTSKKENIGFIARPSHISRSIEEIFKLTSDKRIDTLYLPLLGTGHGGLDKYDALLFLLLSIKHALEKHRHIKEIYIIITPKDAKELTEAYRVQYLKLLKKSNWR